MKNQETGEFELVLGNKQLLSGFFIVVILFGVFFTMGYIVGRNSAPSPKVAAAGEPPASSAAAQPETRPQSAAGAVIPPQNPPDAAPGAAQPAATETAAAPPPAAPPAAETAKPAETAPPPDGIVETAPGDTYLQVMAVKRPEAEVVLKTLRDKGFRALLGHGPNELVRVLVGPLNDAAALGQTKAGLENAGFHPIVRK